MCNGKTINTLVSIEVRARLRLLWSSQPSLYNQYRQRHHFTHLFGVAMHRDTDSTRRNMSAFYRRRTHRRPIERGTPKHRDKQAGSFSSAAR